MRITFDNPATVGDDFSGNKKTVTGLEVVTIAFNLKADRIKGHANVSITLECPGTGFQVHHVYTDDSSVPEFWAKVKALELDGEGWMAPLIRRLISDGKLPPGTLS
jgi:hypothetical protein